MAVTVNKEIAIGLDEIRKSGLTNMFDRNMVVMLLYKFGHGEAAKWVENNRKEYGRLIFEGLEVK